MHFIFFCLIRQIQSENMKVTEEIYSQTKLLFEFDFLSRSQVRFCGFNDNLKIVWILKIFSTWKPDNHSSSRHANK